MYISRVYFIDQYVLEERGAEFKEQFLAGVQWFLVDYGGASGVWSRACRGFGDCELEVDLCYCGEFDDCLGGCGMFEMLV